MQRERKLDALQLLSYRCIASINVLWLFLTVPWVGLLCVVPDHTHLLFVSVRCSSRYGYISTLCWNRRILILAVFTLVAIAQNKNDYKRFIVLKMIELVVKKIQDILVFRRKNAVGRAEQGRVYTVLISHETCLPTTNLMKRRW